MNSEKLKERFSQHVEIGDKIDVSSEWNPNWNGVVVSLLDKACGGTQGRHALLEALIGKRSSKELTDAEWYALHRMVCPTYFRKEDGTKYWRGNTFLKEMCLTILEALPKEKKPPIQIILPFF